MDIKDKIAKPNVIYKITKDIEVNTPYSLPEGCTLDFQGGVIRGSALLTFNNTRIKQDGCVITDYIKCPISGKSTFVLGQKFANPSDLKDINGYSTSYKMWVGKEAEGNKEGWIYYADAYSYLNEDDVKTINGESIKGKGNIQFSDKPFDLTIVDNLTEGGSDKALSAEQGKVLNEEKVSSEGPTRMIFDIDENLHNNALRKTHQILTDEEKDIVYRNLGLDAKLEEIIGQLANGFTYMGVANPTSVPTAPKGKEFYIARENGTYKHFGNNSIANNGLYIIKYDTSWSVDDILYIKQEKGNSLIDLMSQDATMKEINKSVGSIITDELIADIEETLINNALRKTEQLLTDDEKTTVMKNIGMDKVIKGIDDKLKIQDAKIENIDPVIIQGDVTNAADEEDLTSTVDKVIKLKDRLSIDGLQMGYKILRKNKSFKIQVEGISNKNTIFELRYNFDLKNETINIPEGCLIKFNGGSLSNGTLNGNNTFIEGIETISGIIKQGTFHYMYQKPLKSGENIKTVNGKDLLGSGNIIINEVEIGTTPPKDEETEIWLDINPNDTTSPHIPDILQATGTSTIDVMSQKSVTDALKNLELPIATDSVLGGVKAKAKTEDMTEEVGVDDVGRLFTKSIINRSNYIILKESPLEKTRVKRILTFNISNAKIGTIKFHIGHKNYTISITKDVIKDETIYYNICKSFTNKMDYGNVFDFITNIRPNYREISITPLSYEDNEIIFDENSSEITFNQKTENITEIVTELTDAVFTKENCIYEIRSVFDLGGSTLTLPNKTTLFFNGGCLQNGKIKFQGTTILGTPNMVNIIPDVNSEIANHEIDIKWFGAKEVNDTLDYYDNSTIIQRVLSSLKRVTINGTYRESGIDINEICDIFGDTQLYPFATNQYVVQPYLLKINNKISHHGNLKLVGYNTNYGMLLNGAAFSKFNFMSVDLMTIDGIRYLANNNNLVQFDRLHLGSNGVRFTSDGVQESHGGEYLSAYAIIKLNKELPYTDSIYYLYKKDTKEFFACDVIDSTHIKIYLYNIGDGANTGFFIILCGSGMDNKSTAHGGDGNCLINGASISSNSIGIHSSAQYGPMIIQPIMESNGIAIASHHLSWQMCVLKPYFENNILNMCCGNYMNVVVIEPIGDMYNGCYSTVDKTKGIRDMVLLSRGNVYSNKSYVIDGFGGMDVSITEGKEMTINFITSFPSEKTATITIEENELYNAYSAHITKLNILSNNPSLKITFKSLSFKINGKTEDLIDVKGNKTFNIIRTKDSFYVY